MSIEILNVSKAFGAFRALDNVSINFPSGELIALLGPSGCGKTTLLRIIAGLDYADQGRVILDGVDAADQHVRERGVGFVFQHYALFRHMNVFENIAFGLRVRPRSERPTETEIRGRVSRLLDLVQLSWLKDRYPSQLSGGQRQRVALARALAVEPRVLLLDEPFGALDAKVRKELRRWLRRLHDEMHISSVFVTHDQEEALEVADRVVLMNQGRVVQVGSPRELYAEPATAFAYGFLGNVNEFRGKFENASIVVGNEVIPAPVGALPNGTPVTAFARPHDLVLSTNGVGIAARVNRILDSGPTTRVELVADEFRNGSSMQYFEAELTRADLDQMRIAVGEVVRVSSRRLKLFNSNETAGGV